MDIIKILTLSAIIADFVISTLSFSFKLYTDKILKTNDSLTVNDLENFEEVFLRICNEDKDLEVIDLHGTASFLEPTL